MEIIEKAAEGTKLRFVVNSDEESLLSLLKVYLEQEAEVELVGVYKEHHLIDKTEFFLKTKKEDATKVLKKALSKVKKDLDSKKVK